MKKGSVGRVSDEALYSYFLSARVHLSLGKNVTTALFDNIKHIRDFKLKKILTDIRYDMFMNGTSFSDAFKSYEKSFPPEIVPLLCMGEATGTMEVAVKSCESLLRMRVETDKAIKDELTYPIMVLLLSAVVFISSLLLVAPSLISIMPNGSSLDISGITFSFMMVLAVSFAVFILLKILSAKIDAVGKFFHMLKLHLPVYGKVERAKVTAICSLCLDIMMKNGLSGLMIYDMLMKVVPNKHVKANLEESYESLLDGVSIDVCIRTTKGFIDFFYTVPLVSTALDDEGKSPISICAEYAKGEMRTQLKKLVSFIQPAMLVIIGGIIASVFLSIFLPYLDSMQGILDMI